MGRVFAAGEGCKDFARYQRLLEIGLGNKESVRALRNSIQKFQPDIVFLSETKQKKRYLEKIRMKMKLEQSFYGESIGLAGGLSLWWSKDIQTKILGYGKHYIDAEIAVNGEPNWFGTFIYGPSYKEQKKEFWELLKKLRNGQGDKWLVIGDSNVVTSQDEKLGGLPFNPNDANSFFDFVDSRGLIDMTISGETFTWSNQRSADEAILEKLDKVLCSPEWNILFPKAVAMLDIAMGSDHAPVIIHLQGLKKKYKKEFKFESKWLLEGDCKSTVQSSWEPISQPRNSHRFGSKLRRTKYTLIRWSKLKDRVRHQRKLELERRIESYQGKQLTKEELTDSNSRNGFVFEGQVETPVVVWNRAEGAFREFSIAQPKIDSRGSHGQAETPAWSPPSIGHFKTRTRTTGTAGGSCGSKRPDLLCPLPKANFTSPPGKEQIGEVAALAHHLLLIHMYSCCN
ncbi:hypothetical protein V6N11_022152 [Hibiscus sabdariffa]|uniref:Endonuclease/exonuclease/phosphatase domain-containing protein n=1 Tax=Hibiscus sabdariffa TaxID=183260 RepID=A0ABR2TIA7_9ROSI